MLALSGRDPETSTPVPPAGFSPELPARRCTGRALTASAIGCNGGNLRLLCLKLLGKSGEGREYPQTDHQIMLEPHQWDSVLSRARGTIYRNTERISSNALLNLLEVGPDPVTRHHPIRLSCGRDGPRKNRRISLDLHKT